MANELYLQTLPTTEQQFSNAEIEGYLASIENAGGRQNVTLQTTDLRAELGTNVGVYKVVPSNDWTSLGIVAQAPNTLGVTAALGNHFLLYRDSNNWQLFEGAATTTQAVSGVTFEILYSTNVIASIGGYTDGDSASLYSNVDSTILRTSVPRTDLIEAATTDDVGRRVVSSLNNEVGTVTNSLYWNGGTTVFPTASNFISINGTGTSFDNIANGTPIVIVNPDDIGGSFWQGTVSGAMTTATLSGGGNRDTLPVNTVDSSGTPVGSNFRIYFGAGLSAFNTSASIITTRLVPVELDITDFLDFFITNVPTDTAYDQTGESLGTLTLNSDSSLIGGNVAGSLAVPADINQVRTFNIESDDFSIGDILRLRIYAAGVDKNDSASVPLLDLRKQISLELASISTITGTYNSVPASYNQPSFNLVVFTLGSTILEQAGSSFLPSPLIVTNPIGTVTSTRYFFNEAQIRIDRSSQVEATGFRTAVEGSATLIPADSQDILIDIASTDNQEVGTLLGDISQTFIIPPTEEHNQFFNSAYDAGGQIIPGTSTGVGMLLNDATDTLVNGTLTLEGWNESTGYEVQINAGVVSLADALEGKDIADADWSALNHTYSVDTWRAMDIATTNPAYYYPLIDRGFDSEGRPRIPDDIRLSNSSVTVQPASLGSYTDNYGNQVEGFNDSEGRLSFRYDSNIHSSRLVGPSPYFGEVSTGPVHQGFITHPSTPLRIDQLSPAFQLKQVLNRIFELAGGTYEDSFMDMLDDVYVLPILQDGLGIAITAQEQPTNGFRALQSTITFPLDILNDLSTNDDRVTYRFGGPNNNAATLGTQSFTFPASRPTYFNSDGEFVATQDGSYEFNFIGNITNITDPVNTKVRYRAVIKQIAAGNQGGTRPALETHVFDEINRSDDNDDQSFDINASVNLTEGDRIVAQIEQTFRDGNTSNRANATLTDCVFRTVRTPLIWEGQTVNAASQWNDEKAIDILLAIQQKFNLVITPDKTRRNHYFVDQKFDWVSKNVDDNRPRLIDWSERIDESSMVYAPLIPEQHKTINFTDAESDDVLATRLLDTSNELAYGALVFNAGDESLADGDSTIGEYFAPTIVASMSTAGEVIKSSLANQANGIPHLYELEDDGASTIAAGIRIGYRRTIDLPSVIYYGKGMDDAVVALDGTTNTFSNVDDSLEDDLNYSNTGSYSLSTTTSAYNKYWKQEIDWLYDAGNVKLTADVLYQPHEYTDIRLNDTITIQGSNYLAVNIDGFNLSNEALASTQFITYQDNFNTVFTVRESRFATEPQDVRTNTVGIEVIARQDTTGNNVLDTTLDNALVQDEFNIVEVLAINEVRPSVFNIQVGSRFDVAASDITDNSSTLTGVTTSYDDASNGGIDVTVTITGSASNIYQLLQITAEVTPRATDAIVVTLNIEEDSTGITNGRVSTPQLIRSGRPGETVVFNPFFAPVNTSSVNYELNFPLNDNSATISGLSTSYEDFALSVIGVYTYRIPDNQTSAVELDVEVNGTSTALPSSVSVSTLRLEFSESPSRTNVSIRDRVLVIPGIASTQIELDVAIDAAFGFEITSDEFFFTPRTGTNGAAFARETGVNQIQQSAATVLIPSMATLPTTGTSTISVPVTMGEPEIVGTPRVSRVVTYNATGTQSHFTLSDAADTFVGSPDDALLQASAQLIITAAEGRTFLSADNVNVTGMVGVTNITKQRIDNSVVLTFDVPSASALNEVGSISFTVTTSAEPYRATVVLNNQINGTELGRSSFSWGFSQSTEVQVLPEMTTTIRSVDPIRAFNNSSNIPSASGSDIETSATGVVTVDGIASGVITLATVPTIPANTAEDVTFTIDINGATALGGSAPTIPATVSATITRMSQNLPAMGGSAQFSLVADGDWEIVAEVLGGGAGTVNTAGSYSESLTLLGLTIVTTGTFGPISGGAGTHTITVEADPRPFAFGNVQADGSINFLAFAANNGVQLDVVAPGTTTSLDSASVSLQNSLGGRTVTLPAGVSEATLIGLSQSFENWTFQS